MLTVSKPYLPLVNSIAKITNEKTCTYCSLVIDRDSFLELPKPKRVDLTSKDFLNCEDHVKHVRRMKEHYGGPEAKMDHFVQVECGFKHTLLLNKRG